MKNLIENIDYYLDEFGQLIFTKEYHLKRGNCCLHGCLHCPYHNDLDPFIPQEFNQSSINPEDLYFDDNDDSDE